MNFNLLINPDTSIHAIMPASMDGRKFHATLAPTNTLTAFVVVLQHPKDVPMNTLLASLGAATDRLPSPIQRVYLEGFTGQT